MACPRTSHLLRTQRPKLLPQDCSTQPKGPVGRPLQAMLQAFTRLLWLQRRCAFAPLCFQRSDDSTCTPSLAEAEAAYAAALKEAEEEEKKEEAVIGFKGAMQQLGTDLRVGLAVGETVILLTRSLSIPIETPTKGRGGCSRLTVSRWLGWLHPL